MRIAHAGALQGWTAGHTRSQQVLRAHLVRVGDAESSWVYAFKMFLGEAAFGRRDARNTLADTNVTRRTCGNCRGMRWH